LTDIALAELQNARAAHILRHVISEASEVKEEMTPVEIVLTMMPAVAFVGSFVAVNKLMASISKHFSLA